MFVFCLRFESILKVALLYTNITENYWIYKMRSHLEESTPCIYRDRLYILSADAYVHAIE